MAVSKEQKRSSLRPGKPSRWQPVWGVVALTALLSSCGSIEQALAPDPQLSQPENSAGNEMGTENRDSSSTSAQPNRSDSNQDNTSNRSSSAPHQADSEKADSDKTSSTPDQSKTAQRDETDNQSSSNSNSSPEENGDRPPLVAQNFPDLVQTPIDLRDQVLAVANLGVLTIAETDIPEENRQSASAEPDDAPSESTEESKVGSSEDEASTSNSTLQTSKTNSETDSLNPNPFVNEQGEILFAPNQLVTRRLYARWLLAANNAFYGDRPSLKLRLAAESSAPAFKDVKATDRDFSVIQGLAEAGILPSALSGAQEQINFKPDKPLTRQDLLLWKLPLDVRGELPPSNLEAVKEAWGFQDASKISTPAQRAVLADYQNGEQAVTRRLFGYTTLFQPAKPVTRAEAAAALAYFGTQDELISAEEVDAEWMVEDPEN